MMSDELVTYLIPRASTAMRMHDVRMSDKMLRYWIQGVSVECEVYMAVYLHTL